MKRISIDGDERDSGEHRHLKLGGLLRFGDAGEPDINAPRQIAERIDPFAGVGDHVLNVPAGDIEGDDGAALAVEMADGRTADRRLDLRHFGQWHGPVRALYRQLSDGLRAVAVIGRQNQNHVDRAVPCKTLPDRHAREAGFHDIQHIAPFEAVLRHRRGDRPHHDFRLSALMRILQIDDTGDMTQDPGDAGAGLVQRIEIVAEDVHHHVGRFSRQTLAHPVAEEGDDFGVKAGIGIDDLADRVLRLGLVDHGVRLQFDMELAAVRTPGVFAKLGPPDLLFGGLHVRQGQQFLTDPLAERHHFVKGRARRRAAGLHYEMALAKVRHELAAERRQPDQSARESDAPEPRRPA